MGDIREAMDILRPIPPNRSHSATLQYAVWHPVQFRCSEQAVLLYALHFDQVGFVACTHKPELVLPES